MAIIVVVFLLVSIIIINIVIISIIITNVVTIITIIIIIIKSPQPGVTLCFQFVSAASAAATTFVSHVKTVWTKP